MFQRKFNVLIMLLLVLAIFGFVNKLITNPMYIVNMLLLFATVGAIFYFLYCRFVAKRIGKDMGQYKQAARYSAKKYQNKPRISSKSPIMAKEQAKNSFTKTKKRRSDHHLKVIEGKKGKKKNRAL